MDLKGKKLLILCGNTIHCKVVEAAKEMNVYTIVTDSLPLEDAPAKQMADEALFLDVRDVDAIVDYCREHCVDGVLNFCNDLAQRPQRKICEALGLPCFGTEKQYHLLTDKMAFKKMCIDHDVDVISEYSEDDIEFDRAEYPVLIKPVDSRGSRGQAICHNKDEAQRALLIAKSESSNQRALIEKCMAGKQDFSMSYYFRGGKGYLTRTGDRYLGAESDGLNRQCIGSVSPSKYSDWYLKSVHQRIVQALIVERITHAPVFMQGFVDGDKIRFYDPGLRFPGTEYEKILLKATGIDLMKDFIAFSLGQIREEPEEKLQNAFWLNGNLSIQLLVAVRGGKIGKILGLDQIKVDPNVIMVSQRYFEGETVPSSGDVRQRFCEIAILAPRDEAESVVRRVQEKLKVLDEKGNNMLVSQFDPNVLKEYENGGGINVSCRYKFDHIRSLCCSLYLEQNSDRGNSAAWPFGYDAVQYCSV